MNKITRKEESVSRDGGGLAIGFSLFFFQCLLRRLWVGGSVGFIGKELSGVMNGELVWRNGVFGHVNQVWGWWQRLRGAAFC